jgi:hypothetical protein
MQQSDDTKFVAGTKRGSMRFTVEFEMHSYLGDTLADAVQKAMSALGSIDRLRIVPMTTYTFSVELDPPKSGADTPVECPHEGAMKAWEDRVESP